jgi:hypothetical protein
MNPGWVPLLVCGSLNGSATLAPGSMCRFNTGDRQVALIRRGHSVVAVVSS